MTPTEVEQEVAQIIAAGDDDPERSHGQQDELVERVIRSIAVTPRGAQALASAVLPLFEADLTRWYA